MEEVAFLECSWLLLLLAIFFVMSFVSLRVLVQLLNQVFLLTSKVD